MGDNNNNNTKMLDLFIKKSQEVENSGDMFKVYKDDSLNKYKEIVDSGDMLELIRYHNSSSGNFLNLVDDSYPIIPNETYRVVYLLNKYAIVSCNWASIEIVFTIGPEYPFIDKIEIRTGGCIFTIIRFIISEIKKGQYSFKIAENLPHFPGFIINYFYDSVEGSCLLEMNLNDHDSWQRFIDPTINQVYSIIYNNSALISIKSFKD